MSRPPKHIPGSVVNGATRVEAPGPTPVWRCPCGELFGRTAKLTRRCGLCPRCRRESRPYLPTPGTRIATALLAAADLANAGLAVFSEWDLTVAAWGRDLEKFGMRGYAHSYPDHKLAVSVLVKDIMGRKYVERIARNYYKLTGLGLDTVLKLKSAQEKMEAVR